VVSPLELRVYYIKNISCPIDMIPRGVRDYFIRSMKGHSVEGSVRRAQIRETGEQVVILSLGEIGVNEKRFHVVFIKSLLLYNRKAERHRDTCNGRLNRVWLALLLDPFCPRAFTMDDTETTDI